MMTKKVEKHICIKFCQKPGHLCSATYDMIQTAFGNEALGCTQIKEWFRWCKEGRMSVKSDEHSGRPSTSRNQPMIDRVHFSMLGNQIIIIRELSDELGLSFCLVQSNMTEDLDMKHVAVKFFPKLLTVK
jgi:hypothetical protein